MFVCETGEVRKVFSGSRVVARLDAQKKSEERIKPKGHLVSRAKRVGVVWGGKAKRVEFKLERET